MLANTNGSTAPTSNHTLFNSFRLRGWTGIASDTDIERQKLSIEATGGDIIFIPP